MKLLNTLACGLSLVAAVACGGSSTDKKECNGGECATECTKKECMENSECKSAAVIDNMMSRRSIRNYKQQAVPREVLNRIMECGINAPNGQNKQSWEVRVLRAVSTMLLCGCSLPVTRVTIFRHTTVACWPRI